MVFRDKGDAMPQIYAPEQPDTIASSDEKPSRRGNARLLVSFLVAVFTLCALLSYFVKPRLNLIEIVSPEQELAEYVASFPGGSNLNERVKSSFGLAMILEQSPYIEKNIGALENIRHWANHNFQQAPDFLHPASVPARQEPNDTVIGAIGYNLFTAVEYMLRDRVAEFLSWRISEFHYHPAYQSFQIAFFDLFGKDSESATLLARYQSDKAKTAIPILIWTAAWSTITIACALGLLLAPRRKKFDVLRCCLSTAWLLSAAAYASGSWSTNSIPSTVSALLCACVSIYLWKPFVLRTRTDESLKVSFVHMSSRWVAFAAWLSFTVMAITVLTWIRGSVAQSPDPVTLLLAGLSGNFIQDPEDGKHVITRALGFFFLCLSVWAFLQRDQDAEIRDELEDQLNSL